jgi:ATPase subunit of ABC transporter with duplicated ATPase domains
LFQDLTLILERGDRVALIGRNGAGKSSLLRVLAGDSPADSGQVLCDAERVLVPQGSDARHMQDGSPGEVRRHCLQQAMNQQPDLLLLDEPTHDLDRAGLDWLDASLRSWRNGLILVSHDRRLLRGFRDFFVVAEAGCRHFVGSFDELLDALQAEQQLQELRYASHLRRLTAHEQHHHQLQAREQRKKNVGRIHELERCPARIRLNDKRSYAQEKQGRRRLIRAARLGAARTWAEAARRALSVDLPLAAAMPELPPTAAEPIASLQRVSARTPDRVLFENLSLELKRQRVAITGPNGSGKSTLLELLAGTRRPQSGRVHSDPTRIGYIAQNAANWCTPESLLHQLIHEAHADPDTAARCLRAHKFPFALAERPLASLSPGERLRAALIGLLQRPSPPELLILDEPTSHLDFLGYDALRELLVTWRGGLVVASHDDAFLQALQLDESLSLQTSAPYEPRAELAWSHKNLVLG